MTPPAGALRGTRGAAQLALDLSAPVHARLPLPRAPYQRGSETSRDAAERAAPGAQTTAMRVLAYVRATGATGATRKEIERGVPVKGRPMPTGTACARLNWLEEKGYVRKLHALGSDGPELVKRENCAVYVATEKRP